MKERESVMGPVDYMVVMFPGNKFTGKLAPEMTRLENKGIIKVIDLVMIMKDGNGNVRTMELRNLGGEEGEAFKAFSGNIKEWFAAEDLEAIGDMLPNNSSAAALLFENTWAQDFKEAMLEADAKLVSQGRIPHELVMAAMKQRITDGGE
ncbi:MAG: DUF6325 family protein [Methanomassiliicoccus sp.]|nr:DUF6325 family protein [Methanomassiliicoccus sp.]